MSDYTVGDTVYFMFTTRRFSTGAPHQLAGTPAVSAYEDNSTTQITAGITLGVDHDTVTGLNLVTVVASGANGFESGKDYHLVITAGTVDSVSVVGEVVGRFTLQRSAAAVDLANGTDGLGAIKTDTAAILADTGTDGVVLANGAITTAKFAAGAIDAAAIGTGAIDADSIAADAITAAKIATGAIDADAIADNAIDAGAIAAGALTATKFAAGAIDAAALAADAGTEIADAVWAKSLTELSADPGASPAASGAVLLPYMAIRNKRDTTSTADEIHNNAGTVLLTAALSDDGTTFTKAKYA